MKKLSFLPRLESLRGVAALTVVGYHVNGQLSEGLTNGTLDSDGRVYTVDEFAMTIITGMDDTRHRAFFTSKLCL
jgi:peptidoglycan/LPS O-acetylase OafA/YrhL